MYFRNAVRIDKTNVEALHNLGVCLMNQQRAEEAAAYFLRYFRV
jgi:cytochrome c-type biogenesis protein CcmH/NrfG